MAIWYFFLALYNLGGVAGMTAGVAGLSSFAEDYVGSMSLGTFGVVVRLVASLLYGMACGLVAWGLWTLKSWGWGAGVVLGILILPGIPVGTFVGAVTIIYLLKSQDAKRAFKSD